MIPRATRESCPGVPDKVSAGRAALVSPLTCLPMKSFMRLRDAFIALALAATLLPPSLQAADAVSTATSASSRTITGRISNAATGARLEGARVELQGTGRAVMTDPEGRYFITATAADTGL